MNEVSLLRRQFILPSVLATLALLVVCGVSPMDATAARKTAKSPPKEVVKTPETYLAAPPLFLQPENESYFVAIEIPYDLMYDSGSFFLNYHGQWFASDFFEGPWERVDNRKIPVSIRGNKIQQLRETRIQISEKFLRNKEEWPPSRLFVPETIDDESTQTEDTQEFEIQLTEKDLPPVLPKLKGEE